MHIRSPLRRADFAGPMLLCLSVFSLSLVVISFRSSSGLSPVWPSGALFLAALLISKRQMWPLYVVAVLIAMFSANILAGRTLLLATTFTLTNIVEAMGIALFLTWRGRAPPDFDRIGDVLRFIVAVIVGSAIMSLLPALATYGAAGNPLLVQSLLWFTSHCLGLLVITPMVMICYHLLGSGRPPVDVASLRNAWPLAVVLALVVGIHASAPSREPLLFLMFPAVMLATFRLRALGAIIATLIFACVSFWFVLAHVGGAGIQGAEASAYLYRLQFYTAVLYLSALPVSATLAERDRLAAAARANEQHYRSVVENVCEVIFHTDQHGRWTFLNAAWERLVGSCIHQAIGRPFMEFVVEADRPAALARLADLSNGKCEHVLSEFRYRTQGGEVRWLELACERLIDTAGAVVGTAGVMRDITDRKALEAVILEAREAAERAAQEANTLVATDDLTGLASRRHFLSRLAQEAEDASRNETSIALAIFDIDHFKHVNDGFGHAVGDMVLRDIAKLARMAVREGDLIGRLGGEEFGVIMPGASANIARRVGEGLREAIANAVIAPSNHQVTVSVGIAICRGSVSPGELLSAADNALYAAKRGGRNLLTIAA